MTYFRLIPPEKKSQLIYFSLFRVVPFGKYIFKIHMYLHSADFNRPCLPKLGKIEQNTTYVRMHKHTYVCIEK
jgi:hypothetical protein